MTDEIDNQIRDYRMANSPALMDSAHFNHKDAVSGLEQLYRTRFPDEQPTEPAIEPRKPISNADEVVLDENGNRNPGNFLRGADADWAETELSPAETPEQYEFNKNVQYPTEVKTDQSVEPVTYSPEFETEARTWLHAGETSPSEGKALEHVYVEELTHGFTQERQHQLETETSRNLFNKYGERHVEAVAAAKRVVEEVGGQKLKDFLNQTNLGSHPRVVNNFIKLAVKRGYFKES